MLNSIFRHKKALFLASLCTLFVGVGCQTSSTPETPVATEPLRKTRFMMGTSITLSLYDMQDKALLDRAFDKIAELENTLSLNQDNTLLTEVNQNAGIEPTVVTPEMFDIVEKGLHYSALTDGAFDITVGPLVKLWNIGFPDARVPDQEEIDVTLPLIDYTKLELDDETKSLYLETPGMQLDLGSIAKGYTADQIASFLRSEGVEHALIDLGGNLYTLGTKPDNSLWKVGVQDPYNPRGQIIGYMEIANKSIVTSGIYERFLEHEGSTYHHILDPDTGYPFENDIAGVTIISDTSLDGDALSTAIFSKGIIDGLDFVNTLEGVDALFISKDRKVYMTEHLKEIFVLNNPEFSLGTF